MQDSPVAAHGMNPFIRVPQRPTSIIKRSRRVDDLRVVGTHDLIGLELNRPDELFFAGGLPASRQWRREHMPAFYRKYQNFASLVVQSNTRTCLREMHELDWGGICLLASEAWYAVGEAHGFPASDGHPGRHRRLASCKWSCRLADAGGSGDKDTSSILCAGLRGLLSLYWGH